MWCSMRATPDPVMHGDVMCTKRKLMNELPLCTIYQCIFPCICCIEFVRNKGHVLNDLASAKEWWPVSEMGFKVWRKATFWQGKFLAVWPSPFCAFTGPAVTIHISGRLSHTMRGSRLSARDSSLIISLKLK